MSNSRVAVYDSRASEGEFRGVRFLRGTLSDCTLIECSLDGCEVDGCDLADCTIVDCVVLNCALEGCTFAEKGDA